MGTRVSVVTGTGLVLLALASVNLSAQSRGVVGNSLVAENGAAPAFGPPASSVVSTVETTPPVSAARQPQTLKPAHMRALTIERGILTVDGLAAKVALNFQINDLHYLYIYVPGVGTTVISDRPFAGAVAEKNGFDGKTLTVTSAGERLQLTAQNKMLGRRAAYVKFDPTYGPSSRMPVMGYGNSAAAPYEWPGAMKEIGHMDAHPVPASMKPILQKETVCGVADQNLARSCNTAVMTVAYRR